MLLPSAYCVPCQTGPNAFAIKIVCGGDHSCALLHDGSIVCWGLNSNGQLGIGNTVDQYSPKSVSFNQGIQRSPCTCAAIPLRIRAVNLFHRCFKSEALFVSAHKIYFLFRGNLYCKELGRGNGTYLCHSDWWQSNVLGFEQSWPTWNQQCQSDIKTVLWSIWHTQWTRFAYKRLFSFVPIFDVYRLVPVLQFLNYTYHLPFLLLQFLNYTYHHPTSRCIAAFSWKFPYLCSAEWF